MTITPTELIATWKSGELTFKLFEMALMSEECVIYHLIGIESRTNVRRLEYRFCNESATIRPGDDARVDAAIECAPLEVQNIMSDFGW